MAGRVGRRSLRFRLLVATLLAMGAALVLAGLLLSGLFRDHVMRQFGRTLTAQLDQLTARVEFDADGQVQLDEASLSDPRWVRPYSGLYWQIDRVDGARYVDVLRSRSLWDAKLKPPPDALADGEVHVHELRGPQDANLMLVERTVSHGTPVPASWRLMVAADTAETAGAVSRFAGALAASMAILMALLGIAAVAQVAVGLAPLRALQRALSAVHAGRSQRIDEAFPPEVQPLVDDFNRVLDRNAEIVTRARTQAGNLAHAIRTPLATLAQAAALARRDPQAAAGLAALVDEQTVVARRQVDWHLSRARAAAAHRVPGVRAAVGPAVAGLVRVMERVHAERGVRVAYTLPGGEVDFAGELQDLQEMVGNLIDNACKWARGAVEVTALAVPVAGARRLRIVIEDDGPGIPPERRAGVLERGARLDESVPGSGLGLGIVCELAALYGGSVHLGSSAGGGLRVELELPAA